MGTITFQWRITCKAKNTLTNMETYSITFASTVDPALVDRAAAELSKQGYVDVKKRCEFTLT